MFPKISPFAWVSFALITGVMSTALISPLYPLYKEAWHLQTSDITGIYVAYMSGALMCLLFLGRVPDRIGFRRTMIWSLALSFLGTLFTMLAWNMSSILLSRFVVGISSTLMTSSAAKGLAAVAAPGQEGKVSLMSGFLLAFGFGLGPLLGGIIGQWFPIPLITAYVPSLVLSLVAIGKIHRISDTTIPTDRAPGTPALQLQDCLPKLTWTDRRDSLAFALVCSFPFMAFGVFGLYAALSPLFVDKLIPWHGPVVSGTAIATILLVSSGIQILANRLPSHRCGMWGMLAQAACSTVLVINLKMGSATLFVVGVLLAAVGHAMCLLPSITLLNRIAPPHKQTGLFATYLVIGYAGSIIPALGLGRMADIWGLDVAVTVFCAAVIVLSLALSWAFSHHPRLRHS